MKFKKNIGPINRTARILVGAVIIGLSVYYANEPWKFIGIAIGGFMIAEGIFGFCVWHTYRGTKDMR